MRSLVLFALLFAYVATPVCAQEHVNVIYINADDLGVMDVGFNSDRYITPNIDQLRAEGMLFTEAYAPAANCAPSRACVLSGQYGPRHGVYTVGGSARGDSRTRKIIPAKSIGGLNPENANIGTVFRKNGYKTIHLGKWHAGVKSLESGFDVNIGGSRTGRPGDGGYFSPFSKGPMERFNERYPEGTHRVDIYADQAIQFMREHKARPFFMHMAYYAVHTPLERVPEFVHKYDSDTVQVAYATMIEKMDQGIGHILDELDRLGLKENTLVLFCSDNGGIRYISHQDPYRSGKGSYLEGGIREPLVVRWPKVIKANSSCAVPVSGIDFFPTFLAATGVEKPEDKILDGVSLVPLFNGNKIADRALFWHFPIYLESYAGEHDHAHDPVFRTRPGSVIRKGNWKLHEYFEDGHLELYNLKTDLGERKNVAHEMSEKTKELYEELKQWRTEINAPVPVEKNPEYDSSYEPKIKKGKNPEFIPSEKKSKKKSKN